MLVDTKPTTVSSAPQDDRLPLALFVVYPRQAGTDRMGEYRDVVGDQVQPRVQRPAGKHPKPVLLPTRPHRLVGRPRRKQLRLGVEQERGLGREAVEVAGGIVRAERRDDSTAACIAEAESGSESGMPEA